MTAWEWIETTRLALTVRDSLPITAMLSGLHVVGMTVVVGAALVSMLRLTGLALGQFSAVAIISTVRRGLLAGAALSVVTGALLVLPRAASAVGNDYFFRKMVMLGLALVVQLVVLPHAVRAEGGLARLAGPLGFVLWAAVAVLGCMYTLVE